MPQTDLTKFFIQTKEENIYLNQMIKKFQLAGQFWVMPFWVMVGQTDVT